MSLHDLAEVIDTGGVIYPSSDPSGDLLPLLDSWLETLGKLFLLSSMMGSSWRSRRRLSGGGTGLWINRKTTTKNIKTKMTLPAAIATGSQISFPSYGFSTRKNTNPPHHFVDNGLVYGYHRPPHLVCWSNEGRKPLLNTRGSSLVARARA